MKQKAIYGALAAVGALVTMMFGADPAAAAVVGLCVGNIEVEDLKTFQETLKKGLADVKEKQDESLRELKKRLLEAEQKIAGRQWGGSGALDGLDGEQKAAFYVNVGGERVPVLAREQKAASFFRGQGGAEDFSVGEFVQNVMLGRKAASSSALVPTGVGSQIIDDVRVATTVVRAGSGTIMIDGPTNLARVTGDPTVYEHTEAAADVSESDITIVPVSLDPKALIALVPMTMEVVEDSSNLDAVLRQSLAAAFASKLDALALATILADAAIPTSASSPGQNPALWADCLAAVGAALGANQPLPSAMITNTADFIARASQLASTGGTWLGKPPVLADMLELPTTALAAGKALYGGFERSFAVAMRSDLRLEVIRWGKAGSGSHILVAHMRAAGVVLQPKGLFIQLA